jgi:hypothetical protein
MADPQTTATDPTKIVRILSSAQKQALLWMPADRSERRRIGLDGGSAYRGVVEMNLAERRVDSVRRFYRLTHLGAQVRVVLDEEALDDEDQKLARILTPIQRKVLRARSLCPDARCLVTLIRLGLCEADGSIHRVKWLPKADAVQAALDCYGEGLDG